MFQERPAPAVDGWLWVSTGRPVPGRVPPDGCMDLIWTGRQVVVAGPDTRAFWVAPSERTLVGLRLPPGALPSLLRRPATTLADQRVPLASLWDDGQVRRLTAALARTADPSGAGQLLVDATQKHLARPAWTRQAVELLDSGHPVRAVAGALAVSERHLRRMSEAAFGYSPRMLGRILRLQRALRLRGAGLRGADLAVTAGFFDQAHLSRELTGFGMAPAAPEARGVRG